MFEKYIEVLKTPKAVFEREKNTTNLMGDIKLIGIAGLISGILAAISIYISNLTSPALSGAIGIGAIITVPIMAIINLLIGSGFLYLFARLFSGKGNYNSQTHLIALYTAPIMVLSAILNIIPMLGAFVAALLSLYSLYLLTMALKATHGFSTTKAIATWLVPAIVLFIVAIIIILAIGTAIFSIMGIDATQLQTASGLFSLA
jgi:hypothetical protein